MLRIGIDFDNTIACYDRSFLDVAAMMGLVTAEVASSKVDIKAHVMRRPNGETDWQRLQGQVYGKHMLRAEMFPGFLEFLCLSRLRGHRIFIVSHKSEFGHFDEERIPLRDQALDWLEKSGVLDESRLGLRRQDVYFEPTREDKVNRIAGLECTHFVDDLNEVFEEPHFPAKTQKILFSPAAATRGEGSDSVVASWRALSREMFGNASETEVCRMAQAKFPQLGISASEIRKGRGNSRVYRLMSESGSAYALKVYPDRQHDPRPRLETEFSACQELTRRGYPVSQAVAADVNLNWGIYRWISGAQIEQPDNAFLGDAAEIVTRLCRDGRSGNGFGQFPLASEACLNGAEIERQIQARFRRLHLAESKTLDDFLDLDFSPVFALAIERARRQSGRAFDLQLSADFRLPSPSDFGCHNAFRTQESRSIFFDFEYFGWDDPVKLVSDFYWHPGMRLGAGLRERWVSMCMEIFRDDESFAMRLNAYLPLFGLRWCLILLNEFLSHGSDVRIHADSRKARDLTRIRAGQLNKSRRLLQEIKEVVHDHGSAIQAS